MQMVKRDNPVLSKVAEEADFSNDDINLLVSNLRYYANVTKCGKILGCSLPQFGVSKRIVLCRLFRGKNERDFEVMVNPRILFKFGFRKSQEGCESLGGKVNQYVLLRPTIGLVKWYNETGVKKIRWFTYKDMRVIQHEIDHLNGLLIDRGVKVR